MNLSITARGYKAPERLKKYIGEKVDRKKRIFEDVLDFDIILSYEKQTQVADFKIMMNNKSIIITEKSDDIFKSIDLALDSSERQIKRHKEKQRDHSNKKIVDNLVA